MKYKLIQRKNPKNPAEPPKWYAARVNTGKITQKDISDDIVDLSSLSRGDVSNVIDNLLVTVPKYMLLGKSVNLSGLGTFRISFSSKGVETKKAFQTRMISRMRVIFVPSTELRKKISDLKYERLR